MRYHVIYSFEVWDPEEPVEQHNPPLNQRKRGIWKLAEQDLDTCDADGGVSSITHKRRKWVAELSQSQFDKFVEHCDLYAEDAVTADIIDKSLGFGWLPSWKFSGEHITRGRVAVTSRAYVKPIPETQEEHDCLTLKTESELRKAFLVRYGLLGNHKMGSWGSMAASMN